MGVKKGLLKDPRGQLLARFDIVQKSGDRGIVYNPQNAPIGCFIVSESGGFVDVHRDPQADLLDESMAMASKTSGEKDNIFFKEDNSGAEFLWFYVESGKKGTIQATDGGIHAHFEGPGMCAGAAFCLVMG